MWGRFIDLHCLSRERPSVSISSLSSSQRSGRPIAAIASLVLGAGRDNFRDNLRDGGLSLTQSVSYT